MLLAVGVDACVCSLSCLCVGCCPLVLLFDGSFACACCLLFVVFCLVLFDVCWFLLVLVVGGLNFVDCNLVLADCGLSFDACLFNVRCLLLLFAIVGRWLLLLCDVCCAVVALHGVLFVACCVLFVVCCHCLSSVGCLLFVEC